MYTLYTAVDCPLNSPSVLSIPTRAVGIGELDIGGVGYLVNRYSVYKTARFQGDLADMCSYRRAIPSHPQTTAFEELLEVE
jgi:hypothetical protein